MFRKISPVSSALRGWRSLTAQMTPKRGDLSPQRFDRGPSRGPDAHSDAETVRQLQLEVLRLETKLRDLHGSDSVATRRALETLQQHVRALITESEGLSANIAGLDSDPFSQAAVEEELTTLSATALATYIADRVLKASQLLDSSQVRGALWILSGTYATWRVTFRFWQKLRGRIRRSARNQQELEERYRRVAERIEVMGQLLPPPGERDSGYPT